MRIIGGSRRRRQIVPPRGFRARPTTDFAKENLFNVLQGIFDFEGIEVLDLFSGTGSISYEFASRGARRVVSVEQHPLHQRFIADTARELSFERVIESIKANAFVYLRSAAVRKGFDIVFADPPYDLAGVETLPELVLGGGFLQDGGIFVLEHGSDRDFSTHPGFWQRRSYGSVQFSFFRASF